MSLKKYVYKKKIYVFLASLIDAIGYRLVKRSAPAKLTPRTILLIRMDHIGDVLLATPVPRLLKERYPDARIVFLTGTWGAPLLEKNPYIDEVITYDAPWFAKGRARFAGGLSWGALGRLLTEKRIDLAITLRGDVREILLMHQCGIPARAGYGITGGGFFLTHEVTYQSGVHEMEHNLNILRALGASPGVPVTPEIHLTASEEAAMDQKWSEWGIRDGGSYAGFLAESALPSKNWPRERVTAFLEAFLRKYPQKKVVLVGSNAKLALTGHFDPLQLKDLRGKTSLRELCFLMKKLEFFIGPDSGPAHLAATLGVPSIFLYSGTNEFEQWRPLQRSAVILRETVPCSPCGLTECNREGHPCMTKITPESVLDAVASIPASRK